VRHGPALAIALAVGAVGGAASANEAFLRAEAVPVIRARGALPKAPDDAAWSAVAPTEVWVAPQRTVRLNDRDVNPRADAGQPARVEVRALSDGTKLALHLTWADRTEDRAPPDESARFGDAVAVEMPLEYGAGRRLPYVGMGDERAHVLVAMVRATTSGAPRAGTYVAAGFGSLTRAPLSWMEMAMAYDARAAVWRATFVRPLRAPEHDAGRALVPFAIAVWDGGARERGGNKSLSRWRVLHSTDAGVKPEPAYLAELAYGYGPGDAGSADRGRALVESTCVACHRFGAKQIAPPGMAPDLTHIGVIATWAYLRDSITQPSEVVVPGLRTTPMPWFSVDDKHQKHSKMPSFTNYTKEQLADVLAYLKSLGVAPTQSKESSR
jgi:DMSO reductase family type II enzyme heme b subunit